MTGLPEHFGTDVGCVDLTAVTELALPERVQSLARDCLTENHKRMMESPMDNERAEAEFAASPRAPAEARRWVSAIGYELGASSREMVMLLLSELVSNSVRHGRLAPGDHIDIILTRHDSTVRVEVHDEGMGIDLASAYHSDPPREHGPDQGYGLVLVNAMAASWGVDASRPTTVWFEFDVAAT